MKSSLFALCIVCTSCSMYQSHFDCPPGKGIGCKPVSEVLHLIVEKEKGEDLFITDPVSISQEEKTDRKNTLYLLREHVSEKPVLVEVSQ